MLGEGCRVRDAGRKRNAGAVSPARLTRFGVTGSEERVAGGETCGARLWATAGVSVSVSGVLPSTDLVATAAGAALSRRGFGAASGVVATVALVGVLVCELAVVAACEVGRLAATLVIAGAAPDATGDVASATFAATGATTSATFATGFVAVLVTVLVTGVVTAFTTGGAVGTVGAGGGGVAGATGG